MRNSKNERKSHRLVILLVLLIVLLFVCGGGLAYYLYIQPSRAVENFLKDAKALDFDALSSDVLTGDLSPLEEAHVTDSAYEEFFRRANAFMTYDIGKTSYRFTNATVSAVIQYADGTEIYKQTISDITKQIASSAFSGDEKSAEDLNSEFSRYLSENSASLGQSFSSISLDFQLIKENGKWYVDAISDDMAQVLSVNFLSAEQELTASMSQISEGSQETSVPQASAEDRIDLIAKTFTIQYTGHQLSQDMNGNPCLLVYYNYTNLAADPSSAMVDVNLRAYQNGQLLEASLSAEDDAALDQYMESSPSGQTVSVCQAFALLDSVSDVTLAASEAYSFNEQGTVQLLKLS
ncbi:MAG: DUF5067 domain-containing protein [Eubacteriales bacterium]|nr:DUF5067 domain-containing protein [Eubacteriales bacterium]